jgi:transposase
VLRGEHDAVYTGAMPRAKPAAGPYEAEIERLLRAEHEDGTRRKQRLTARRIYVLLRDEHAYSGSEVTVRRAVREIRQRLGYELQEAFVPLVYEPGVDGQVDFFEADVRVGGDVLTHTFLIVRACYSTRHFVCRVPAENQEALFEGLMAAFEHFDGVFHNLWFDNLTPAVEKVLRGRAREVQRRFADFQLHYAFVAEFCAPAKGNEKGGVEGGVKYVRRNALTPVLDVRDLGEVDRHLEHWMAVDDERVVIGPADTVGCLWQVEAPVLIPRPRFAFDAGRPVARRVSAYSLVPYRTNLYSVPVEFVGASVMVKCYAQRLEIHGRSGLIAEHPRLYGRNETSFHLEHYLPLLAWKTRAFDHAAPVRAASKEWPPAYHLLLRVLRDRLGQIEGTRSFIEVLWQHKYHPLNRVERAVRKALTHAEPTYAVVLAYLDRARRDEQPQEAMSAENLSALPQVRVHQSDITVYDRLRRGGR